jgi:hypothetical protein
VNVIFPLLLANIHFDWKQLSNRAVMHIMQKTGSFAFCGPMGYAPQIRPIAGGG